MKKIFYVGLGVAGFFIMAGALDGVFGLDIKKLAVSFMRYTLPSALVWLTVLKYKKHKNSEALNLIMYAFGFYTLYIMLKNIAYFLT